MACGTRPMPIPRVYQGSTGVISHQSAQPTIPGTCYKLQRGGSEVVVSGGHPFTCACRWNDSLLAPDRGYVSTLAAYPVLGTPARVWDDRQRYLDLVLGYCPDLFYPFEAFGIMTHNPLRAPEIVDWVLSCPLGFEPLIALGSAFDLLRRGRKSSPVMTMTVANVCGIIGQTLYQSGDSLGGCFLTHAICSIAQAAFSVGDTAAWRTHMEGLRRYLDTANGEFVGGGKIQMNTMTKVRIADIEGAITTGSGPYLPFKRVHPLLPSLLPTKDLMVLLATFRPPMQACGIDAGVSDTIIAACIFIQKLRLSREQGNGERFDPENIMEDWYGLQYDLLTSPDPLLTDDCDAAAAAASYLSPVSTCSSPGAHAAAPEALDAFAAAFRIAVLMSLRAPTLQWPWGRPTYQTLLSLLERQLRVLVLWLRHLQQQREQEQAQRRQKQQQVSSPLDGENFIDPWLLHDADGWGTSLCAAADDDDDEEDPLGAVDSSPLPSVVETSRPFLVWMAVAGYQVSVYYGGSRAGGGSIYAQLLGALGIRTAADAGAVSDADLAVAHMLDLSWSTGVACEARDILRRVVA